MNQKIKIKNKGTKVLFTNPVLERLTRTNSAVPVSLFCLLSVLLTFHAVTNVGIAAHTTAVLFVSGFLFFTLLEYLAHRYFFHMETSTKIRARIQYAVHGLHHEYPKDKERLAMPPFMALIYAGIFYLVFLLILGELVYAFLPGILLGYATYLFVHYIVHACQPPKNFLKVLWIHHGIHHYKDHTVAFGVSSPLWDYVFRTMPSR